MSSPDSTLENGHSLTLDSGVSVLSDQVGQGRAASRTSIFDVNCVQVLQPQLVQVEVSNNPEEQFIVYTE